MKNLKRVVRFGLFTWVPFVISIFIVMVSINSIDASSAMTHNEKILMEENSEFIHIHIEGEYVLQFKIINSISGVNLPVHDCQIDHFANVMECCYEYEFLLDDRDLINYYLGKN